MGIVVLLIGLAGAASAASVTVAASNSQVKSTAQYICDGSNDQSEIQAAINQVVSTGGSVYLLDGTFNVAGDIKLAPGVNLIGTGAGITTLQFISEGWVKVDGTNTISDLQSTGPTGFFISGSHVKMTNVTVRNYTAKKGAFYLYVFNRALSDFTFTNCNAIDGSGHGFINEGASGYPCSVSFITYSGCTAINCGRASQIDPWITGFDFAESTDINNLRVENCRAEGCWESGFHFEEGPQKTNVILRDCVSINNGQKKTKENAIYASGFIGGSPSMQYIDCISSGNLYGFRLMNGATAIRCKDTGSTYAFRTTDYGNIVLTDCWSDQAGRWAFYGLSSHDVTVTNFRVTNPKGNPYPALLAGSSTYPSYNMNIQLGSGPAPTATQIASEEVTIPGQLLAANYDIGGEGIAYHDTTPGNDGGVYRDDDVDIESLGGGTGPVIAYTRAGEWLNYQVSVQQTGEYTVATRASNPDSSTKEILLSIDGASAASLQIPGTGSFDSYTTVSTPLQLTAGGHQLRLTFATDRQNLDRLIFIEGATAVQAEQTSEVTPQVTQSTSGGGEPAFTAVPTRGKRSLLVSFTDTSPGSPIGWDWQITGGCASPATSTKPNPSIWLNEAKSYTVTLTVTYADGSKKTTVGENYVTVTN